MTALASFSAPYIFGGGFRVMPTQIVATRLNGDDQLAMVETASLTLLALLALWLLRGARATNEQSGGRKGVAPALVPIRSRAARLLVAVLGWGLALVLLLPHLTLLLVSFVPAGTWTTEPLPPAYTWRNYLTLVQDPVRARPLLNSLWMATAATAMAVAIALFAGILSVRRRVRTGGAIQGLLTLPWAVPGTVFAIALATAFSVHAPLAGRFILVGTLWILPLAYLVRNLPLTGRAVLAGLRGLDPSLDEAAATLGAGWWRTLRRVTLPLLRPALVAGASLAFVTAFGDFVTSIMLYTYDTRPISLEILSSLRQSDVGVAAAYGVVSDGRERVGLCGGARSREAPDESIPAAGRADRGQLRGHDRIHDRAPVAPVLRPEAARDAGDDRPPDRLVLHCPAAGRAALGPDVRPVRPTARPADRFERLRHRLCGIRIRQHASGSSSSPAWSRAREVEPPE